MCFGSYDGDSSSGSSSVIGSSDRPGYSVGCDSNDESNSSERRVTFSVKELLFFCEFGSFD